MKTNMNKTTNKVENKSSYRKTLYKVDTASSAKKVEVENPEMVTVAAQPTEVAVKENSVNENTIKTGRVSSKDVKVAVENFLKNPPTEPLTLNEVYKIFGMEHRQIYQMVRQYGIPVGKKEGKSNRGKKCTLFTFKKVI